MSASMSPEAQARIVRTGAGAKPKLRFFLEGAALRALAEG
jgi:hypothetical protein